MQLARIGTPEVVYRGLSGRAIALDDFEHGTWTEKGAQSFTRDRDVALKYSRFAGAGAASYLLEVLEGEADQGADISPFSYYPYEAEKLYGPLVLMQTTGQSIEGSTLKIKMRVNINLHDGTLDEARRARQQSVVSRRPYILRRCEDSWNDIESALSRSINSKGPGKRSFSERHLSNLESLTGLDIDGDDFVADGSGGSWMHCARQEASGLRWVDIGNTPPTHGRNLKFHLTPVAHSRLAEALSRTNAFTHEELDELKRLGICDLRLGDFVKSGDSYFQSADLMWKQVRARVCLPRSLPHSLPSLPRVGCVADQAAHLTGIECLSCYRNKRKRIRMCTGL